MASDQAKGCGCLAVLAVLVVGGIGSACGKSDTPAPTAYTSPSSTWAPIGDRYPHVPLSPAPSASQTAQPTATYRPTPDRGDGVCESCYVPHPHVPHLHGHSHGHSHGHFHL